MQHYIIMFNLNITMKLRNQEVAPSLCRVIILRSSNACVENRLGELISHCGVTLWVQGLWDIDMNVLDHHKNHEKQCNSRLDTFWIDF
jgi:hypothetical protein